MRSLQRRPTTYISSVIAAVNSGRLGLPEFNRLKYFALLDFINDYQYPTILKENLYRRIEIEKPDLFAELNRQRQQMLKEMERPQPK